MRRRRMYVRFIGYTYIRPHLEFAVSVCNPWILGFLSESLKRVSKECRRLHSLKNVVRRDIKAHEPHDARGKTIARRLDSFF